MYSFGIWAVSAILFFAGLSSFSCGRKDAEVPAPVISETTDGVPMVADPPATMDASTSIVGMTSTEGMVELRGRDVALEMDDLKMTRDELLICLQQLQAIPPQDEKFASLQVRVNGLTEAQQGAVRRILYQLVRQQLLLRAARAAGMQVTEDDRQHILQFWNEQNPDQDIEEYLGQFPETATTPLSLSRNDMFLLFKWTEAQVAEVEVPEDAVQQALAQFQQIKDTFGFQVEEDRKNFAALAEEADLYTDEGFAKMAKEMSDGVEAERGGLIKEPMTRAEIAEANFDQPFTTPVGETSSLIETPTSLRYIRVLEEIPGTMPGEPPKLRIAQILYTKRVLDDLPTEEQIRQNFKYQMQEQLIHAKLQEELAPRFHFRCTLIPDLLDFEKRQKAISGKQEDDEEQEELSEDDIEEL